LVSSLLYPLEANDTGLPTFSQRKAPIKIVKNLQVKSTLPWIFVVAGYISLTSIILVDLLGGVDKLTNAFGLLILFRGGAAMVGTPIAGAVYDATQSYSTSFFIAAGFFALSAAFSFAARPVKRWLTPPAVPIIQDALTPIDEDEEEYDEGEGEDGDRGIVIPEITKTQPSPASHKEIVKEIEQLESVL